VENCTFEYKHVTTPQLGYTINWAIATETGLCDEQERFL